MRSTHVHGEPEDGGAHELPGHPPPPHVRTPPHCQHLPRQLQPRGNSRA